MEKIDEFNLKNYKKLIYSRNPQIQDPEDSPKIVERKEIEEEPRFIKRAAPKIEVSNMESV